MQLPLRTMSLALLAAAIVCTSTGCHTISGFGKDTQDAGEKIEDEAERHIDEPSHEEQPG